MKPVLGREDLVPAGCRAAELDGRLDRLRPAVGESDTVQAVRRQRDEPPRQLAGGREKRRLHQIRLHVVAHGLDGAPDMRVIEAERSRSILGQKIEVSPAFAIVQVAAVSADVGLVQCKLGECAPEPGIDERQIWVLAGLAGVGAHGGRTG